MYFWKNIKCLFFLSSSFFFFVFFSLFITAECTAIVLIIWPLQMLCNDRVMKTTSNFNNYLIIQILFATFDIKSMSLLLNFYFCFMINIKHTKNTCPHLFLVFFFFFLCYCPSFVYLNLVVDEQKSALFILP